MERAGSKRTVGLVLMTSALIMLIIAVFVWLGALGLPSESRTILAGGLLLAAVLDLFVGMKFFQQAS
jgi:hypothetical protein